MSFGINVIGMPYGMHGLGQDLRDKAHSLVAAGCEVNIVELNYSSLKAKDLAEGARLANLLSHECKYDVNLFCLNLTMLLLAKRDRPEIFAGRRNIVSPYWEFPQLPAHHINALELIDEVWVPNDFLYSVFSRYAAGRVVKLPLHVEVPTRPAISVRSRLNISENEVLFSYVFDSNSLLPRKDPLLLVCAFLKAFPEGTEPVRLVLKTKFEAVRSGGLAQLERLERFCATDPRITLLNDFFSREETISLLAESDVYASPHRAEGLGRTVIEAMLLGTPVIVTSYSGISEWLTTENSISLPYVEIPVSRDAAGDILPQYTWALPSLGMLTESLRRLAFDSEYRARVGAAGQQTMLDACVENSYGVSAMGRLRG